MGKIVRMKLTEFDTQQPDLRVDPADTNVVQRTYDNGATWVNSPQDDFRSNGQYLIPRSSTPTGNCDGAASQIHALKDQLIILYNTATALEFAIQVMTLLLSLLGGIGGVAGLAFDTAITVGLTLAGIGISDIHAAFTDAIWAELTCTLSCYVASDGSISATALSAFYADVYAHYAHIIYNVLIELGNLFGWVLLSNAYVEYGDTGDCSACASCAWEFMFEFCDDHTGWTLLAGAQTAGTGIQSRTTTVPEMIQMALPLVIPSDCVVTNIYLYLAYGGGEGYYVYVDGTAYLINQPPTSDPIHWTSTVTSHLTPGSHTLTILMQKGTYSAFSWYGCGFVGTGSSPFIDFPFAPVALPPCD